MTLKIECESLRTESDVFSTKRRAAVGAALTAKRAQVVELTSIWQVECAHLNCLKETKERLEDTKRELEIAQQQGNWASRLRYAMIPKLEQKGRGDEPEEGPLAMLYDRVTSADIARVVAKATGIPVQSLLKGEREKLVHMEDTLKKHIVGQDHVIEAVCDVDWSSRHAEEEE